ILRAVVFGEENLRAAHRRHRRACESMQDLQSLDEPMPMRRVELLTRQSVFGVDPRHRLGIVRGFERSKGIGDRNAVMDLDEVGARSSRIGQTRHCCCEAKTAAPSSPASAFRITFTGIASSSAARGGFSRNARMKVPSLSAGKIFGAIPPPM